VNTGKWRLDKSGTVFYLLHARLTRVFTMRSSCR